MKIGTFVMTLGGLAAVVGALAIADHFSAPVSRRAGTTPDAAPDARTPTTPSGQPRAPVAPAGPGASPVVPGTPPSAPGPSAMPEASSARGAPVEVPYTPATLHDRVAMLARQVESGDTRGAAELAHLLGECASAPHRLGVWSGCGTRGLECEPNAQVQRYREIAESCRNVPYDLIQRRQEFSDLATRGN